MKGMNDTTDFRALKASLIAAAVLVASANSSTGAESAPQVSPSIVKTGQRAETIPLPPIPDLKAVPWQALERAPKGPQIDTLLSPVPDNQQSASTTRSRLPMWPDGLLAAGNTARNG